MGSRITVMFAVDINSGTYMVGEVDRAGDIIDFGEVILSRVTELNRDDAFYLVVLDENYRDLSVLPIQTYKAYFKTHNRRVVDAIADGSISPVTIGNEIIASYNRALRRSN